MSYLKDRSAEFQRMQERCTVLGKAEHFRTVRSCAAGLKEVDWYALAQAKKREQAARAIKLKRICEIRRAQKAWDDACAETDC